ncbi:MAG TPA: hypothetical protein VIM19_01625 [Actinomycetes bacterium]
MADSLLDQNSIIALAGAAFDALPGSVVYADREPRGPGRVDVGDLTVVAEHAALLVFRDEMPGANWMHPCTYAAVDVVTHQLVARVTSDRPPAFGTLPATWVVVSDPDGLADLVRQP